MTTTVPEVTLEDKKLIAEKVMGWPHVSVAPGDNFFYKNKNINKDRILEKNFHPSGIHFYEVIGKLGKPLRGLVYERLFQNVKVEPPMGFFDTGLFIESHKAEIIRALIEILKEGN